MPYPDKEAITAVILRCQQRVFAPVLYLLGGGQDKTYDICAESFAEAVRSGVPPEQDEIFLAAVMRLAVEKARRTKTIPLSNELDLLELSEAEKGPLRIVVNALRTLDFEARAAVILRDQLNLSYSQIAAIMSSSEGGMKVQVARGRAQLRKKLEDTLNYA